MTWGATSRRPGSTSVAVMTETWTAPQLERTDPGLILGERQALEAWLDFHRETLLLKCAGLSLRGTWHPRSSPTLKAAPCGPVTRRG